MAWTTEASTVTQAGTTAVWRLWSDVEGWHRWDEEIAWSRLYGPFEVGTRGVLKPRGGPQASFETTEVRRERAFVDRTRLPLARIDFLHKMEPVEGGTRIVHGVRISGPFSPVFARLLGPGFEKGLPKAVRSLARLAEASEAVSNGAE